ncbi:hypothetical protein LOAG_14903, partial [Loa loa]
RANLSAHLSKVRSDIDKAIPNKDFDGLAIIDYEEWRPLWEHNWYTRRIYHNASLAYVEEQYKNTGKTLTKGDELAKKEFNQAAMNFLTETIREAKNMRPNALWEFYGMPFCNYSAGKNGTEGCGEVFEEFNNRLQPLYAKATAFYPSIYLPSRKSGRTGCLYVTSVLQEAKRCAENLSISIFTFNDIECFPLESADPYYTQDDLSHSLNTAFVMGVQGTIIWSSSKDMVNQCHGIGDYVLKYVDPKVVELKTCDKIELKTCDKIRRIKKRQIPDQISCAVKNDPAYDNCQNAMTSINKPAITAK